MAAGQPPTAIAHGPSDRPRSCQIIRDRSKRRDAAGASRWPRRLSVGAGRSCAGRLRRLELSLLTLPRLRHVELERRVDVVVEGEARAKLRGGPGAASVGLQHRGALHLERYLERLLRGVEDLHVDLEPGLRARLAGKLRLSSLGTPLRSEVDGQE